ncbi:MAG: hypothetical protein NPIRA04_22330 [Nitrospirales bacterium]|nr:MAG: hypothetical protein NPIRA04_22330 [Nitrospirales bacterium]
MNDVASYDKGLSGTKKIYKVLKMFVVQIELFPFIVERINLCSRVLEVSSKLKNPFRIVALPISRAFISVKEEFTSHQILTL